MSRIPTRRQFDTMRPLVRFCTALVCTRREYGPLASKGWTAAEPRWADVDHGGALLPPQRLTPAGLRALADAMERYEGEGGEAR